MRRYSLKTCIATAATLVVSLGIATSGAQAHVFADSNNGNVYGVNLVPGTSLLTTAGHPLFGTGLSTPSVPAPGCVTPAPARVAELPATGLCYHSGGSVIHKNETFALVWNLFAAGDPHSDYAAPYVEQFLRDVADGSGGTSSPYSITSQYAGANGVALNQSLYGGGYTDSSTVTSGCTPTGPHDYSQGTNSFVEIINDACVTDAQIRSELGTMITANQLWRTQSGYTPLFVFMTPPGVETCLDSSGTACSSNSDLHSSNALSNVTAQFCSYHSQLNVGGTMYDYVVQPWSAGIETSPGTVCDEPDSAGPPATGAIDPHTLATDMGGRLVSPLSQAAIAAIVNPSFDGWFAADGSEINDNGCTSLGLGLDKVTVGANSYFLQREFNNAGMLVDNPFALPCAPSVGLEPAFVVPSPIDSGDVVEFDGANSPSTLIIPSTQFVWDFGDGTTAIGPSVAHSYAHGGTYTAKLTVTDRGGYVAVASQQVVVLGPPAPIIAPTVTLPTSQPGSSGTTGSSSRALAVRITLRPQSLQGVLRSGISINVFSSQNVNGIVTVSIARSAAKRAHIASGRSATVVIGRGTSSQIKAGSNSLHLKLSQATVKKLKHLGHVTLTIRLAVVAAGGHRMTIDAAGHY